MNTEAMNVPMTRPLTHEQWNQFVAEVVSDLRVEHFVELASMPGWSGAGPEISGDALARIKHSQTIKAVKAAS